MSQKASDAWAAKHDCVELKEGAWLGRPCGQTSVGCAEKKQPSGAGKFV